MSSVLSELTSGNPHLSFGERAVSVVLGLGLAAAAAKPRPNPLLNLLALVGGSYLAYRGATGYCPVKAALAEQGRHDEQEAPGQVRPHRGESLRRGDERGRRVRATPASGYFSSQTKSHW